MEKKYIQMHQNWDHKHTCVLLNPFNILDVKKDKDTYKCISVHLELGETQLDLSSLWM
jgi:hypothetical protein